MGCYLKVKEVTGFTNRLGVRCEVKSGMSPRFGAGTVLAPGAAGRIELPAAATGGASWGADLGRGETRALL